MNDPIDPWFVWVLNHRHAGDSAYQRVVSAAIARIRDRVLDGARLETGMTLADIGTGDGLIAFGAFDRIGPSLKAYLTDVSASLLCHAEDLAKERGIAGQCTFLEGNAERLQGIGDSTIDALMTRAVLAYVANKPAALSEFYRVLKPGGRISIAEPILRDQSMETLAMTKAFGSRPVESKMEFFHLMQRWKAAQFPSTEETVKHSPIANFSERDLVRLSHQAGFVDIHMELHIDLKRSSIATWDVFLAVSPHPLAPTLQAIMAKEFSESERQLFERVMRPLVESGKTLENDAIAYLTASKPAT